MPTIRSRKQHALDQIDVTKLLGHIHDAIKTAECPVVENKELLPDGTYIGDDGFLYYHENWVIQGRQS